MNRPTHRHRLAALFALALAAPTAFAQHEHHRHHAPEKPAEASGEPHDPAAMDHSGMDHTMMDHSAHGEMDHAAAPPPAPTDAERAAAFPDLGAMSMRDHGMDDDALHAMLKFDEFGWRRGEDASAFGWDIDGWIGRDLSRLRLRSEGVREAGRTQDASVELLYSRAFSPWWDWVAGIRHETRPGPSRSYAAFGVQGLAPYKFELKATAYLGESGHGLLRLSGEYELLFTDRLILTPELGLVLHGKADPRRGTDRGEAALHAGLKLRYEIRPDLAPYIGYERERGFDQADGVPRRDGGQWMAGLRFWF